MSVAKVAPRQLRDAHAAIVGTAAPEAIEDAVASLEKHFSGLGLEMGQCDVCAGWSPETLPDGTTMESCPFCNDGKEDDEELKVALGFVYHLTDSGNAQRFAHRHGKDVRFVAEWGSFLIWTGKRWEADPSNVRVGALAGEVARSIYGRAADEPQRDEREAIVEWAQASESRGRRDAMVALLKHEPGIAISHSELDRRPWLFNVANGTVDLKTGELREHRREDLLTKLVPIVYDPSAPCPGGPPFLRRVMGDDGDMVAFLGRAAGYSITGSVEEHVLFLMHGEGQNGKSTFCRVLLDLAGDYGQQGAPTLLLAKHNEPHPTEDADLFGARAVVVQEVDKDRSWAEAKLKQLTGGDVVKARRMRENFWSFEPTFKFWVAANNRPKVKSNDVAMWRRIKLLPFNVTIPEQERDRRLLDKLRGELPRILAWAVRGCLEWQRVGLAPPKAVEVATQSYRDEEDSVARFIEECCTTSSSARMLSSAIHRAYVEWSRAAGEEPESQKAFSLRLQKLGFVAKKTGPGMMWSGIAVRAEVDFFEMQGAGSCTQTPHNGSITTRSGVQPADGCTTLHPASGTKTGDPS